MLPCDEQPMYGEHIESIRIPREHTGIRMHRCESCVIALQIDVCQGECCGGDGEELCQTGEVVVDGDVGDADTVLTDTRMEMSVRMRCEMR